MSTTLPQPVRDLLPKELQGKGLTEPWNFDQLYRFAQIFQASGMFTDVTDTAQAFVKICKGSELGMAPTVAMTAFDIIQKRLFIKPWAIAALINACGYGGYRVMEQTAECCSIVFLRKYPGTGWRECPMVSYTIAEAQAHGLVQRSPHWKASPAHMLYQRAMGRGGAMYFPELLAGLHPPQDDTPIEPEDHAANIEALFGPQVDPTAPLPHAGIPLETAQDAPQSTNAPQEVVEQGRRRGQRDAPRAPQGIWREQLASLAADLLGRLDEGKVNGGLAQRTKDATQKAELLARDHDATDDDGWSTLKALQGLAAEIEGQTSLL
jgi:hypothetical protein